MDTYMKWRRRNEVSSLSLSLCMYSFAAWLTFKRAVERECIYPIDDQRGAMYIARIL